MSLFSIETVPVLLDAETYIGDKREYTQIILETEYIALTDNNYVPLTQMQILKKSTEHTCMSSIYYNQESDIKVNQCNTIVLNSKTRFLQS